VSANASIGYWNRGFIATGSLLGVIDVNSQVNGWSQLLGGNAINGASLSRANAVMYSSPTFGGFSVSASWGEDDQWDAALRYAGEHAGFRIAAGLGYRYNYTGLNEATRDNPGVVGPNPEQFIASGSILHVSSGLFLTASYVNQDNDNGLGDTTSWYVQGGISKNWTGLGKTVVYGEYARVDDGLNSFSAAPLPILPAPFRCRQACLRRLRSSAWGLCSTSMRPRWSCSWPIASTAPSSTRRASRGSATSTSSWAAPASSSDRGYVKVSGPPGLTHRLRDVAVAGYGLRA
jgi:hypothetical protein